MPSDRDALLAAIRAEPDEDTPRLAFADWLEENDEPHWAGLIRAECELARLATADPDTEAVYQFLTVHAQGSLKAAWWAKIDAGIARRIELAREQRRRWPKARRAIADLIPKTAGLGWTEYLKWTTDTHRGFPHTLYVTRRNHVDVSAITHLPAFHLKFGHITTEPFDRLCQWIREGLLRHACGISIPEDRNALVAACSVSLDVKGVRSLAVEFESSSIGMVVGCLHSPRWKALRQLELRAITFPREDALHLFRAKHLRKLTHLRLTGGYGWTKHTIRELNTFTELRELDLSEGELDDTAAEALAALPGLKNLRSLRLNANQITGRGATALLTSPHLRNLAVLDLEANPASGLDAKRLAKAKPGALRVLRFESCGLTASDVAALAASPVVRNLTYLDLSSNSLNAVAAAALAKGFGDHAPTILHLNNNRLANNAANALVNWPGADRIHRLSLWHNWLWPADSGTAILKKRFGKRVHVG